MRRSVLRTKNTDIGICVISFEPDKVVTESAKKYIKDLVNVDIGIVLVDEG